ncbi:4'-phosphopantetheinyl transferase superfamily protein [Nonomuraea sp. MCN248]|uniref:4'-phosphopantetheinyl transferase superfamily protein n=1 Tax=Nonomuraea corallina TaxID=2989783 RepID=A0ABT4SF06_9ACTN|nr:4'-phosphopantetheinyl transferase superfamily protein [Nonomuraea corallina]MDA0635772.1 4'-phosphopantetheinyl transferase superfamily protein [Nonomuraea corallina]
MGEGSEVAMPRLRAMLPSWVTCAELLGEPPDATVTVAASLTGGDERTRPGSGHFPSGTGVNCGTDETGGDEVVAGVMVAAMAGATPARRQAFAAGRACAAQALRMLGMPAGPIPRGAQGAPVWPPGVTGSITHCPGYAAAAAARDGTIIGVDAEPCLPVPPGVLSRIAAPAEIEGLERLAVPHPGRLLFSAKESVYKACFPLTGRRLGFLDAEVAFDPGGGFTARLTGPGPRRLEGRWTVADGLALTAIAMPCPG